MAETVLLDNLGDKVETMLKLPINVCVVQGSEGIKGIQSEFKQCAVEDVFEGAVLGVEQSVIVNTGKVEQVEEVTSERAQETVTSDGIKGTDIIVGDLETGLQETLSLTNIIPSFNESEEGETIFVVPKGVYQTGFFIKTFIFGFVFIIDLVSFVSNPLSVPVSGIFGKILESLISSKFAPEVKDWLEIWV